MLYAKEVPPVGGDTLFANRLSAYDALSDGMKAMASRLRTFNLYDKQSPRSKRMAEKIPRSRDSCGAGDASTRTYPSRDEKTGPLYQRHADHDAFRRHDTRREPTVDPALPQTCDATGVHLPYPLVAGDARHLGQPMPLFMLDDYADYRRVMHRITIKGDATIGIHDLEAAE